MRRGDISDSINVWPVGQIGTLDGERIGAYMWLSAKLDKAGVNTGRRPDMGCSDIVMVNFLWRLEPRRYPSPRSHAG